MKTVIIYSGGMDSTALLYRQHALGDQIQCLNFYYGSKHNEMERAAAMKFTKDLQIPIQFISLDFIGRLFKSALLMSGGEIPHGHYVEESMKQTVVPFRNGIMLSIAAGFAASIGFDQVSAAIHAGDHTIYPDCRPEFFDALNTTLKAGLWESVQFYAPFINMTKGEICAEGALHGASLENSYSCYEGDFIHCGQCGACTERQEAFRMAGVPDYTTYKERISV